MSSEDGGEAPGKALTPQRLTIWLVPAVPEGFFCDDPASPSVLQEVDEREEVAPWTRVTSQDSAGPLRRLATVSTRTSMRRETDVFTGGSAAKTRRTGVTAFRSSWTQRKPCMGPGHPGSIPIREETRTQADGLIQFPPRTARVVPVSGPVGF